jgi:hypothetical protein
MAQAVGVIMNLLSGHFLCRTAISLHCGLVTCLATYYSLAYLLEIRQEFPIGYVIFTILILIVFELLYQITGTSIESSSERWSYLKTLGWLCGIILGSVSLFCMVEYYWHQLVRLT